MSSIAGVRFDMEIVVAVVLGAVVAVVMTKLLGGGGKDKQGQSLSGIPTLGYHKIRGLAGPLRMMMFFKGQKFVNKAYGSDLVDVWFKKEKPEMLQKNAAINLPYIIDGDTVVTQSNSCLLYLGKMLGIDKPQHFFLNHQVLDQTMDLRNDLMKIVYPFSGTTLDKFSDAAKAHMKDTAPTHLKKLEGLCVGPYMCGGGIQSGDFHVFEMLDQHKDICKHLGVSDVVDDCLKLKTLHSKFKKLPQMQKYYSSEMFAGYPQNNPLPPTNFTGLAADYEYPKTTEETITP